MLKRLIIGILVLGLTSFAAKTQTQFDDASRAVYICDVIKYITWPNESSIDTFRLGVLAKDDNLVKELRKILVGQKLHDKPVKVKWFTSLSDLCPVEVVFLKKESGFDIDVLLYRLKGENTLVISENYEFHKSMINFIVVNNKKRFEMNSELMKDEGFSATVTFAALAVQTEADWKVLYKEANEELQAEKQIVEEQKMLLEKQQREIESQIQRINALNDDIRLRQLKIEMQDLELLKQNNRLTLLSNEAKQREAEISEKIRVLDAQEKEIEKTNKEIASQGRVLHSQQAKIDKQKGLITTQNTLIKEQNAKILAQALALTLFIILLIAFGALIFLIYRSYRIKKESNRVLQEKNVQISEQKSIIEKEKDRSEKLLLNILPAKVADDLKKQGYTDPQIFRNVTVFFGDFVGFTKQSSKFDPKYLIGELNEVFTAFDNIIEKHGCERIKTIGDAYFAVCGMPVAEPLHAEKMLHCALDVLAYLRERNAVHETRWEIRIGIHSGDVVGGVVGVKKYIYDLFGDTINTASRMESHSEPMQINVSESTYLLLKDKYPFIEREPFEIKGKGLMKMYFLEQGH